MRASAADFEDAGQCALFGFVTPQQKDDGGRQNASLLGAECGGREKGAPALTGAVCQRSRRASRSRFRTRLGLQQHGQVAQDIVPSADPGGAHVGVGSAVCPQQPERDAVHDECSAGAGFGFGVTTISGSFIWPNTGTAEASGVRTIAKLRATLLVGRSLIRDLAGSGYSL